MTHKKTIIIILVMLVTIGITTLAKQSQTISPNKPFETFPTEIGNWKGIKTQLEPNILKVVGVDDYILGNYQQYNISINLYVGFYKTQKEGDLIHSPKNCLPGAGWNITQTSVETVMLENGKKPIKVIKLMLEKGVQKQIVLYWFQSRGRIISSEYMQKIWLVIDSITRHRTDGSFVRLIAPVVKDEATTLKTLKDFINELHPILDDYIPT